MNNKLLLLSKNDIPFQSAQITIHAPTINEISFIGQENFFRGLQYLTFSKKLLKDQDKIHLKDVDDFQLLMELINRKDIVIQQIRVHMKTVLFLLFPDYKINFLPRSIMIFKKDMETNKIEQHLIDKSNFKEFRQILTDIFCLNYILSKKDQGKYNPAGPQAKALVQKFEQRHKILAKLKNQGNEADESFGFLFNYANILSIGLKKDINQLLQYTIYQLIYEFRRFKAQEDFHMYFELKLAGAEKIEQVQHWMNNNILN